MNFRNTLIATVTSAAMLGICGCGEHHEGCGHQHHHEHQHDHEKKHDHAHEHEHKHGESCSHGHTPQNPHHSSPISHLTIPLAVQKVMGLKTVRAEMRRVASTISFSGRYELNPDARQKIATPVSGRLTLHVKALTHVKKGQSIFSVSSPELVARAREIDALEKRLAVYREIKTPNAALENELAVKRAEREALLAGADEKDGTVTVRAAEDGMIESLLAQNGAWLETGAAAVQTVQMHDLRFKALAAASDAIRLKDSMPAKVGENAGRIQLGVGDDSGLVPVYVLFDSEVSAIAGERGHAECVTDEAESPHAAIPSKCLVSVGLQPTVFMKDPHDAERFIAIPVIPGASGGGWTAVEGLSPHKSEIVCEGAYELKLALPSAGAKKESGHFHADGTFHTGEH
jgi:hypothetical protein